MIVDAISATDFLWLSFSTGPCCISPYCENGNTPTGVQYRADMVTRTDTGISGFDNRMSNPPPESLFDRSWRAVCEVVPVSRAEAEPMIRRHYICRWPGVCVLILGLRRSGALLGVIVFALPPRETMKRYGGETWELARLWIDDSVPKNAESYVIGRAVRHIKRNRPEVVAIVSYADPSAGHTGTIYKAANWIADGRTDQERKTPRFDYADAATGKRYSRRGHVPAGVIIRRVPRVSKHRFFYKLR